MVPNKPEQVQFKYLKGFQYTFTQVVFVCVCVWVCYHVCPKDKPDRKLLAPKMYITLKMYVCK